MGNAPVTALMLLLFAAPAPQAAPATPAAVAGKGAKRAAPADIATQIKQLETEVEKLTELLADDDLGADKDIRRALHERFSDATCSMKRLKVRQALGASATGLGDSIYQACRTRMLDEFAKSEQPVQAPPPQPAQAPAWCELQPFSDASTAADNTAIPRAEGDRFWAKYYRLIPGSSGVERTHRGSVYVAYINRLRYGASLGGNTTYTDAPPLPGSIFSPGIFKGSLPLAAANVKPKSGGEVNGFDAGRSAADEFDAVFQQHRQCYTTVADDFRGLQQHLDDRIAVLNTLRENIKTGLQDQPWWFQEVADAKRAADLSIFPAREVNAWPSDYVARLATASASLRTRVDALSSADGYTEWMKVPDHKTQFDALKEQLPRLDAAIDKYRPTTETAKTYEENREALKRWRHLYREVAGANEAYFVETFPPPCGGWFGKGSRTQMQVKLHDRLDSAKAEQVIDLDVMLCQSPLTVTSGLGFSFIPDRTPAFMPTVKLDATGKPVTDASGNQVIVQSLGYSSESKVRPAYSMLVNTALYESRSGNFGFHWALGTAITGTSDGATIDFLIGPSLSFRKRTFFVTPAYDLGRRTDYTSAFKPGDLQGNLSSPPTQQRWRSGFGLSITFPFFGTAENAPSAAAGKPAEKPPANKPQESKDKPQENKDKPNED